MRTPDGLPDRDERSGWLRGVGFIASEVQHFTRPMATFRALEGPAPQLTVGVAHHREAMSPLISALVRGAATVGRTIR